MSDVHDSEVPPLRTREAIEATPPPTSFIADAAALGV